MPRYLASLQWIYLIWKTCFYSTSVIVISNIRSISWILFLIWDSEVYYTKKGLNYGNTKLFFFFNFFSTVFWLYLGSMKSFKTFHLVFCSISFVWEYLNMFTHFCWVGWFRCKVVLLNFINWCLCLYSIWSSMWKQTLYHIFIFTEGLKNSTIDRNMVCQNQICIKI